MNVTVNIAVDGTPLAVHHFPTLPIPDAAGRKVHGVTTYTSAETEAALCAWEWILENRDTKFSADFDAVGTSGMRQVAQQAGRIVHAVWERLDGSQHYHGAFDFDFAPAVLENLPWDRVIDNNRYGDGRYTPSVSALAFIVWSQERANFEHWRQSRRVWTTLATIYSAAAFGCALELDPAQSLGAFRKGEPPTDFVTGVAERQGFSASPVVAI
jgi:hypothetical protein